MFSFFKRRPQPARSLEFIGFDMHNHLLPGIDDGSADVETSLQLMQGMMEVGYSKFICTPHIIPEVHPNNKQTISAAFGKLLTAVEEKQWSAELAYSAEFMLNFEFDDLIKNGQVLPFGNNQVLIEMSYAVESPNIKEAIFHLQTKGYRPILAHPERYPYYYHNFSLYEQLVDAGCDLQLNILSLTGYYGKPAQKIAEKLIKLGWFSWVGTDLHHERHLGALLQLSTDKKVLQQLDKIKNIKNQSLFA
jgi:tyrosine-protein phosphatase YwqE